MTFRLIWHELKADRHLHLVFVIFISLSICLTSLAAILLTSLKGSIDRQMALAKTPHFLQMHTGVIDRAGLEQFAQTNDNVASFQILEFINLENNRLSIGDLSLEHSLQDNGISTQSSHFDFLLDLDNEIIEAKPQEVYLPLIYADEKEVAIGDRMQLGDTSLIVQGYLRDSQMNSAMASSKRFLVHEDDFEDLRSQGQLEYLIEFRLHDLVKINQFEKAYQDAHLEANGPTITYDLFRLINAISEGIIIAVLILVTVLLLLISFLCIRFTLLTKIAEDYRAFGVMKALGLLVNDLKQIYLGQYLLICLISSIVGIVLSFLFVKPLLRPIHRSTGLRLSTTKHLLIAFIVAVLTSLIILAFVNKILDRLEQISPIDALRNKPNTHVKTQRSKLSISQGIIKPLNLRLAMNQLWSMKKQSVTMILVFLLTFILILLPLNLDRTLHDESFVTYMGMGLADLIVEERQSPQTANDLLMFMEQDPDLEQFAAYHSLSVLAQKEEQDPFNLQIDIGPHDLLQPRYLQGRHPQAADEIALSAIYADDLELHLDDILHLESFTTSKPTQPWQAYRIVGIYSDITNGGKSAKVQGEGRSLDFERLKILASFREGVDEQAKKMALLDSYPSAKVYDVAAFYEETLGDFLVKIRKATYLSTVIALFLAGFISILFARLMITTEQREIGIQKALGLTSKDLWQQYVHRFIILLLLAMILTYPILHFLGEPLVSLLFSSLGIMEIEFLNHTILASILIFILVVIVVYCFIYPIKRLIQQGHISQAIER